MELSEIIERLQYVKTTIADSFDKGTINFDEIVGELEEIAGKLQSASRSSESDATRQHLLKPKNDLSFQKSFNATDFK